MSRKTLVGLPGNVPLVGAANAPQAMTVVLEQPDGTRAALPVVAVHVLTDQAMQSLVNIIGQVVDSIVAARLQQAGLLGDEPALEIPDGVAVTA